MQTGYFKPEKEESAYVNLYDVIFLFLFFYFFLKIFLEIFNNKRRIEDALKIIKN